MIKNPLIETGVRSVQSLTRECIRQGQNLVESVLPESCFLCGVTTSAAEICEHCETFLPFIQNACHQCGLPLPQSLSKPATPPLRLCGECIGNKPAFSLTVAPLLYKKPVSTWISAFKYREKLRNGKVLAYLLTTRLRQYYATYSGSQPEVILPVPIHWTRRLTRGFNQTELLASSISRQIGIPVNVKLLRRQRPTIHQQKLKKHERHKNLRAAFSVNKQRLNTQCLPYRCVALLDDVITTGATVRELAKLLKAEGVQEVHVWAIARTPRKS